VGVELRVEAAAVARRAAPTRRGGVPVWAGGGGLREQCWGRADAHLDWGVQVRSVCLAEYMQYPVPLPSGHTPRRTDSRVRRIAFRRRPVEMRARKDPRRVLIVLGTAERSPAISLLMRASRPAQPNCKC
jgi:hypothetical protein